MTAYILTPEQHSQIVEALQYCYDVDSYPANGESAQDDALAMLKAMKPAKPTAWMRKDEDVITSKEKRPDYAYTHYYDQPLYAMETKT